MINFKTTLSAALVLLSVHGIAVAESPYPGYSLVWSDEFEGDALDRSVWNVEVNGSGCGNDELQYYIDSPDNISLENSCLVITARRQRHEDKAFTSGRLNTNGKMTFTYGILEASIRLPLTDGGLWPAFWAMGDDITSEGWPRCGETDILEMGHADGMAEQIPARLFNGALHWGTATDAHRQHVGVRRHTSSLQDGKFHRYTLRWTPERIEMFVDSETEPYLVQDISDRDNPEAPGYYFHKPNFILLNLAVGGQFPGILNPEEITALSAERPEARMEIDYVRLYQPSRDLSNLEK